MQSVEDQYRLFPAQIQLKHERVVGLSNGVRGGREVLPNGLDEAAELPVRRIYDEVQPSSLGHAERMLGRQRLRDSSARPARKVIVPRQERRQLHVPAYLSPS